MESLDLPSRALGAGVSVGCAGQRCAVVPLGSPEALHVLVHCAGGVRVLFDNALAEAGSASKVLLKIFL